MNRAVKMLQDDMNVSITEFTVTGHRSGSLFAHKWYLGTDDPLDPSIAARKLDEYLAGLNDDYRVERLEALKDVSAEIVPLQVFHDWMKMHRKEGGAHKFPRVLKTGQLIEWEKHLQYYIPSLKA